MSRRAKKFRSRWCKMPGWVVNTTPVDSHVETMMSLIPLMHAREICAGTQKILPWSAVDGALRLSQAVLDTWQDRNIRQDVLDENDFPAMRKQLHRDREVLHKAFVLWKDGQAIPDASKDAILLAAEDADGIWGAASKAVRMECLRYCLARPNTWIKKIDPALVERGQKELDNE